MLTLAEQPLKMESCLNCQVLALSGCPISLGFQKTFGRKSWRCVCRFGLQTPEEKERHYKAAVAWSSGS